MNCNYINLFEAKNRKYNVEENFIKFRKKNFKLLRFDAVNIKYIQENNILGKLKPKEKACFLSHKYLIKQNINSNESLFILEDDANFGRSTCEVIENFLKLKDKFDWDILFTDVIVTQPSTMVELIKLRKVLKKNNQTEILDLNNFEFAGATGYIINQKSINKIYNLLDSKVTLDEPYDLYLRRLILEKKIKGYVIFPFITSLSSESNISQIQEINMGNTDLVWNTFRRMIWIDSNIEESIETLAKINNDICDEESKQFGIIISACISNKFNYK